MDFNKLRKIINAIVYGIFGFILAIILIRLLLKAIGANTDNGFVNFWYELSYLFVGIFDGIYTDIRTSTNQIIIEISSIVAMFFYLLLSFLASKSLNSVINKDGIKIVKNIIDSIFKLLEFFLITRFIFRLTGASAMSTFADFIYKASAIVYEPFRGILPTIKVESYNIVFETSTLIAIIIIIILDIVTEGMIDAIRKSLFDSDNKKAEPIINYPNTQYTQQIPNTVPNYTSQPAQNITINVPQPIAPQPNVDARTVQIFPSSQQQPNYPGYNQNNMEQMRPATDYQLPQYNTNQPIPGQNLRGRPNQASRYSDKRYK